MAQKLLERLQRGKQLEQFLTSFRLFRLFHRLYLAVTSGLLKKMVGEKKQKDKERVKKTCRQNALSKEVLSDNKMLGNRFAVLCNMRAQQQEEEDPKNCVLIVIARLFPLKSHSVVVIVTNYQIQKL
ncbi:uncharacterized protein LOC111341300 [Stylophora pistillata]|uniref:uncharacterized protein LOC111341300 n=1 Tax=Stylophora pistillata TaxID=50429 RepID=UPI000C039FE1|nr:uncharacterized protein LOC111341300 [Stylophora pistillata]